MKNKIYIYSHQSHLDIAHIATILNKKTCENSNFNDVAHDYGVSTKLINNYNEVE